MKDYDRIVNRSNVGLSYFFNLTFTLEIISLISFMTSRLFVVKHNGLKSFKLKHELIFCASEIRSQFTSVILKIYAPKSSIKQVDDRISYFEQKLYIYFLFYQFYQI